MPAVGAALLRFSLVLSVFAVAPTYAAEEWENSAHGRMLRRVLPPGPKPEDLPEPKSAGAHLLREYCVQCHYLPNPAMHSAEVWPTVVTRMDRRMRGEGNIGAAMKELMRGVGAMSAGDIETLNAYLRKHGQRAFARERFPDLSSTDGRAFANACDQCHVLPDPGRHTSDEWPDVVERMQKNLRWVGTVTATQKTSTEPTLEVEKIVRYLQQRSRAPR